MTLLEKAAQYARQHPQIVSLAWVNRSRRTYSAEEAVRLCSTPNIAVWIVGAEAQDKALEDILNQLIDAC